jgi:GNAT superfamily N-acetyltransferase
MSLRREALPVVFEEITSQGSPLFEAFLALYEAAFPIADEREPPEALEAILALNSNLAVQVTDGPYREAVFAIRAWAGGPVIGGHIFGMTTSDAHRAAGYAASVQAIYAFLHPRMRGQVPMRLLVEHARRTATDTFALPGAAIRSPPPVLLEVNNPLRMSAEEIELDTRSSGTSPLRRYLFWRRSGFMPLEFPYVQSALRESAEPVRYLDLFCTHDDGPSLPAAVLAAHLHAFVAISGLKGVDVDDDAPFRAMRRWFAEHDAEQVAMADDGDADIVAARLRALARRR